MRSLYYIPMIAALAACDSGLNVEPAIVQWMEWPAEVQPATPFAVRLLTPFPACHRFVFKPAVRAVDSVVTVEPYFLVEQGDPVCLPSPALGVAPVPFLALDTVIVLEDQADTVGLMYAFARGYLHVAATPVCGQTRVFHLLSRN